MVNEHRKFQSVLLHQGWWSRRPRPLELKRPLVMVVVVGARAAGLQA